MVVMRWLCLLLLLLLMPLSAAGSQVIIVHADAAGSAPRLVSVGIPLPPGMLRDAGLVRVMDAAGTEIPAAVQPTLRWVGGDGSLRAVRVQFLGALGKGETRFSFSLGKPRLKQMAPASYDAGLVNGSHGVRVPAVVATLDAQWLCDSLIAGPQRPATGGEAYAGYVDRQFQWARALPADDATAWLFDRPTTLFKAYVRTGRADYLAAAAESYRFYMKYIKRDGVAVSPSCAGGWTLGGKPCDVKYVYLEPILLAVGLLGDDGAHDAATVDNMMAMWDSGGWNERPGPYERPSTYFTERLAGLGLLETVSGYELTGDKRYLERIRARVGWLADHQAHNPDGLGDDGSWRNSWNLHENDSWNPTTDVRGTSPWMSENIIDGLWHAWLATNDARIPPMIAAYGRYLERLGWIDSALLVNPHDWRNSCSGPDGQIAWYWSSGHATQAQLMKIQESEGWYSDAHTVELALPVAAARYFDANVKDSAAFEKRFHAIAGSYAPACAALNDTLRRFNWNNRGSGVAQWLIKQPAGAGLSGSPMAVRRASP
jgi:hypothetical protein